MVKRCYICNRIPKEIIETGLKFKNPYIIEMNEEEKEQKIKEKQVLFKNKEEKVYICSICQGLIINIIYNLFDLEGIKDISQILIKDDLKRLTIETKD